MSSIATIAAVSTAVVAVASTAYTVISSGSKSGGGQQQQTQPVATPAIPDTVTPTTTDVPAKSTAEDTSKITAEVPDAAKGVEGTIATSGLGDTTDTEVKKKTLLGS